MLQIILDSSIVNDDILKQNKLHPYRIYLILEKMCLQGTYNFKMEIWPREQNKLYLKQEKLAVDDFQNKV